MRENGIDGSGNDKDKEGSNESESGDVNNNDDDGGGGAAGGGGNDENGAAGCDDVNCKVDPGFAAMGCDDAIDTN